MSLFETNHITKLTHIDNGTFSRNGYQLNLSKDLKILPKRKEREEKDFGIFSEYYSPLLEHFVKRLTFKRMRSKFDILRIVPSAISSPPPK